MAPAIPDFDVKKMLYGDTIDQVVNHRKFLRGNIVSEKGDRLPE